MSLVHDMLNDVQVREAHPSPWTVSMPKKQAGLFVLNMPNEILNDFYDLREHIRLASTRDHVRSMAITDTSPGEGSATIATYLSFLMAGGMVTQIDDNVSHEDKVDDSAQGLYDIPESDKIFTNSFRSINARAATTRDAFQNWEHDIDSRYIDVANRDCILLVDANLHSPSIHRYFGQSVEDGLAEIIGEQRDWNELAKPVRDSNLKIITAGDVKTNPVALISSPRFYSLVEEWKNEFRYVIFNSPAVLHHVDALSLAAAVDGVVLVVRAGQTRWDSAQKAKHKLATAQAHLLGVALNRRKMDIPDGLYKRLI